MVVSPISGVRGDYDVNLAHSRLPGYAGLMSDKKEDRRSPIKDPPLRLPGEGLSEQINLLLEDIGDWLLFPFLLFLLAAREWWLHFQPQTPRPLLFTVMAVLASGYTAIRIIPIRKKLQNLRLGRSGEVYVGQELELLREKGFKVLHDVQGEGFNVDHVLIGPKGIFTVETKTWSKHGKAPTSIIFDGKTIFLRGHPMIPDPVSQAKGQANWLRDLIKKQTGKDFSVWPVVVFPGWFVVKDHHGADAWVLNPKVLPAFIENPSSTSKCNT